MKYEELYYFGRANIFVEGTDGTVVMLNANGQSYLGTIAGGVFKFIVPGRQRYEVSIVEDETPKNLTDVEVSFGETKTIKL